MLIRALALVLLPAVAAGATPAADLAALEIDRVVAQGGTISVVIIPPAIADAVTAELWSADGTPYGTTDFSALGTTEAQVAAVPISAQPGDYVLLVRDTTAGKYVAAPVRIVSPSGLGATLTDISRIDSRLRDLERGAAIRAADQRRSEQATDPGVTPYTNPTMGSRETSLMRGTPAPLSFSREVKR